MKYWIQWFFQGEKIIFERFIKNVLEFNSNNMAIIGLTREELKDFIRAQE